VSLASEILAISDLKAYWKMDDGSGTNINDYGPGNHDATATAATPRTAAGLGNAPGKATQFGYTGTGASAAHHADFDIAAAWSEVRCTRLWGHENGGGLFLKLNGFPGPYLANSLVGDDTRPDIRVWGGNTICTATSGITDIDRWHLVIRTWNGTTAKIYVDGVDVSGTTTAPSPSFANGSEALNFGSEDRETIAHLALYGKALSAGEVATLTAAFDAENVSDDLPTLRIGIHQDLNYMGDDSFWTPPVQTMRSLHATISRSSILWDVIEPTQGNFSWTRHDAVLDVLDANDMEMLGIFVGSPTWANGGADRAQVPGTGVDSAFNTWLSLYTGFVTAFCTRYLGRIHRYELWNEPNLVGFWSNGSDTVDAVQYRAWYNAVRSAILAVDPTAKVCFAGLASWSATGPSDQAGETFFRNCMAAGSMTIDHMGLHPYVDAFNDPNTWLTPFTNTFYGDIRHLRDVLLEFGYDCPIWLTEFGWPSSGGSHTETTQRDRLQHGLEGIRDRLRDIAEMAVIFIDYDQGSFTEGLYSGVPPTGEKLSAAMYSTFAEPFDEQTSVPVASWSMWRGIGS
jgi:hypothetical protein